MFDNLVKIQNNLVKFSDLTCNLVSSYSFLTAGADGEGVAEVADADDATSAAAWVF